MKDNSINCGGLVAPLCPRDVVFLQEVLEIIFRHLGIQSLKAARQTCLIWNMIATPELLRKSVTDVNDRFCRKYKKILLGISNLRFRDRDCLGYEIVEHFSSTLSSIRFPLIVASYSSEDIEEQNFFNWELYKSILNSCKKLKSLSVDCYLNRRNSRNVSVSPKMQVGANIKNLKLYLYSHSMPDDLADVFFKTLPSIETIEIYAQNQSPFDDMMNSLVRLRAEGLVEHLSGLKLEGQNNSQTIFCDLHILRLIQMKLTSLQSFEIKRMHLRKFCCPQEDRQLSSALFYQLFSLCQNTLQTFTLYDCGVCNLPIFQFPVMKSLRRLEIYLPLIPDWYRLLFKTNILTQFPKLKNLTAYQKYNRDSSCWKLPIDYWNAYFLELYTDANLQGIHSLQFDVHNLLECMARKTLYQEMRTLFPTLRLLRTYIKGHLALTQLLHAMSNTHVEELYVNVGCACALSGTGKSICCQIGASRIHDDYILRWKKDIKSDMEEKFPNLQTLIIVSEGCKMVNKSLLIQEGLMDSLKNAKKLKHLEINCLKL